MSETNINILLENVTREQQIEIEDICFREGFTITQYFIGLHNDAQLRKEAIKDNESNIVGEAVKPNSNILDIGEAEINLLNDNVGVETKVGTSFPPSNLVENMLKPKKRRIRKRK